FTAFQQCRRELELAAREGRRHLSDARPPISRELHKPGNEEGVSDTGVQGRSAGEEGVGERIAYSAEAQVVDGRRVPELVDDLRHPPALLRVRGYPSENRGHGIIL